MQNSVLIFLGRILKIWVCIVFSSSNFRKIVFNTFEKYIWIWLIYIFVLFSLKFQNLLTIVAPIVWIIGLLTSQLYVSYSLWSLRLSFLSVSKRKLYLCQEPNLHRFISFHYLNWSYWDVKHGYETGFFWAFTICSLDFTNCIFYVILVIWNNVLHIRSPFYHY